ncbi:MAG TPA: PSD1 and planctomycete cytochrome C domain-containing protein [Verrucomicrobiales bacterium]|nr:PSD1 and planctomycete cytochrome C domain-containing protein [Verrucomicrobiales bacterium]
MKAQAAFIALTAAALAAPGITPPAGAAPGAKIDFNRDIRPVLSRNCFFCHGPDEAQRKAGLRLDQAASARADLGGYRAITPGEPQESEILSRITAHDPEERMPPPESGKELTPQEIARIRDWIQDGAAYAQHWAYTPPHKHPVPAVGDPGWPRGWIDRFLLARLDAETLSPSPQADPVTLVRRLYFDLTGLPPSPQEIEDFLGDARPDAWERLADRLLASPAFGEHLAVFWLDLVRFADTVGYHGDQDHNISPYRDYVIEAFNSGMPFDRFTREQLAGDLLPGAGLDQKIASGYNRLLQTSHEGGVQPKEYLAIYAADRVRNVSQVWLAATAGCAQCHDHKYDPISSRDFYALAAFFADIDEARHFSEGSNELPTARPPELDVLSARDRRILEQLDLEIARLSLTESESNSTGPDRDRLRRLEARRAALAASTRRTMVSVSTSPRPVRLLPRGDWLDESGALIEPALPSFLDAAPSASALDAPDSSAPRLTRLDLAEWITLPEKGAGLFTARVFANRFWNLGFGNGLSKTLDDFGGQGEAPVHPGLLDRLALEFVECGWDTKHLLRLIVTSQAYRQSSLEPSSLRTRDPENRLYARQSRYRLPAEALRDNALAVSGLLRREIGGASVKPYQPAGYYRHLNFPEREYRHHADLRQWRRGLYAHWQRQFLHPMLKAFDAPSREECAAQRPRSNTPTAAMVLLNDPTFVEASRCFAERVLREAPSHFGARIEFAFRLAVSRSPDPAEAKTLRELLEFHLQGYRDAPEEAEALLQVGSAPPRPGLSAIEVAAWTSVARALLNLSETVTRN